MSSFLTKKKDSASFDDVLSTSPESTQKNKKYAIKLLDRFVEESYSGRTTLDVIEELQLLKSQDTQTYEDALYGMLQDWIIWNEKNGKGNYTIRVAFSNIRKYLFHMGIKTSEQDIKEYLRFGKRTREDRHPLSKVEYQRIIEGLSRHPLLQALFFALGSSGMRIGEALSLKKKDLDLTGTRIKVNIPANTKTRTGRTTFLSIETENLLRVHLEKIEQDDYVFAKKNRKPDSSTIRRMLGRLVDKLELDSRYQSNNIRKITSHSFRAYFFTKAARKHGENYAHRMTGHGGYLMEYDRMTEEEKLNLYLEIEPDLSIYDQTRNELEINRLQEKVEVIDELKQEVRKLREAQAKSDKKLLETMKKGNLFHDF
ncbi:site-specific integrase [archaeon]|nr:site-specific integrase [archaeon]